MSQKKSSNMNAISLKWCKMAPKSTEMSPKWETELLYPGLCILHQKNLPTVCKEVCQIRPRSCPEPSNAFAQNCQEFFCNYSNKKLPAILYVCFMETSKVSQRSILALVKNCKTKIQGFHFFSNFWYHVSPSASSQTVHRKGETRRSSKYKKNKSSNPIHSNKTLRIFFWDLDFSLIKKISIEKKHFLNICS